MISEAFAGQSVLVTGGAGFIGSHLIHELTAAGAEVTVLDNMQAGKWSNLSTTSKPVDQIEGDIRDAAVVNGVLDKCKPEWIFHLAANASVPNSVQDPVYDFEANTVGTFVVLNSVRTQLPEGHCKGIVAASSGAVYGEPVRFPITEGDLLKPISPYGASKLGSEVQARILNHTYGVPVVMARIFNAYGPRMARFVVLDFLRKLQRNPDHLEILGTGQQVRDFTYVGDTVQGLQTLILKGERCESYNLSSGANYNVTQLAHALIEELGLTGRTQLSYTGSSWSGDAQRWEVSIDFIKGLGYEPKFSLSEGLRKTIEWFESVEGPVVPKA